MKFHRQLCAHDPDAGIFGDCERTAFACLLDKHPSEVPHWMESGDTDEGNRLYREWLDEEGIVVMEIGFSQPETFAEAMAHASQFYPEGFPFLLAGQSPRALHVVIVQDGEMLWDPAPQDDGLIGPCPGDDDGDDYWAALYVARRL